MKIPVSKEKIGCPRSCWLRRHPIFALCNRISPGKQKILLNLFCLFIWSLNMLNILSQTKIGWKSCDTVPNQPGPPVFANIIQTLVHTCRDRGCSIFIEISVKRQSNPSPLKVFNIQHCSAHIQPNTIFSKYHFKKCVPLRHHSSDE